MIDVKEAVDIILRNAKPKNLHEEVYISDCLNRICFENVYSNIDIPTFTRSAMDGYALIFGKDKHKYKIVDNEESLYKNCCIRVNTGFPISAKADAVVEVEKIRTDNNKYIIVNDEIKKERNFTKKGTEVEKGALLVSKGEKISVRKRALMAYAGIVSLKVYQKPIVGIITTGDEVIFPSCTLPANSVFNANFFILEGLVKTWLANPVYFGHTPDKKEIFEERLLYALNRCDIVLTTGGVSKGTKDYTKETLKSINANILFEKTTIKPGKPAAFAEFGDKYIFSLPGWPSALYTVAYLYLKPFLLKSTGLKKYQNKLFNCVLDENMHSQKGKDYFNHININYKNNSFHCSSSGSQKTDNYYSLAVADGLVWLDKEKEDEKNSLTLPFIFFND